MSVPPGQSQRIAGLDTIRFVCAVFVIFFHESKPPLFQWLSRDTSAGRLVLGLYDTVFNGQAAVIAFFVISGFCIHLPYAAGRPFAIGPFFLGRAARILIPTAAYLFLLRLTHRWEGHFTFLLWSVWCEIAYYFLYPLLRVAFARTSVGLVLGCAYGATAVITASFAFGPNWQALFFARYWTVLAGLPCWLLGCLLAERLPRFADQLRVSSIQLWCYRLGAWMLASACYLAMLHWRISFLVSLQIFAAFAYFWFASEICYYREHPANRLLERLGGLTFSLYLIHLLAKATWERHVGGSGLLSWAAEMSFILLLAALFFVIVEAPAHRLARLLSRRRRPAGEQLVAGEINSAY